MTQEESDGKNVSVSMPMGAIGAAAILALAGAGYALLSRSDADGVAGALQKAKPSKALPKKLGLMTVVALIENDATRKVVVAVLKALARRS